MTLCAYGFTGGSWVMHNESWVTGSWVNASDPLPALNCSSSSSSSELSACIPLGKLRPTNLLRRGSCPQKQKEVIKRRQ